MSDKPGGDFKGYVSAEAKRTYSVWVGVLCGLVPLLQIVLPYAFMIPMMLSINPGGTQSWRTRSINKSVYWQDAIWHVSEPYKWKEDEVRPALVKLSMEEKQKPVTVAELPGLRPWLFVEEGKLWILSATHVGFLDGDSVRMELVPEPLENISRPFLYDRKLSALGAAEDGIYLVALENGGWTKKYRLAPVPDDSFYTVDNYEPISTPNGIIIFHRLPRTLWYRQDLSLTRERKDWDELVPMDYLYYYPTVIDNEPAIFTLRHQKLTNTDSLIGLRLHNGKWQIITLPEPFSGSRFAVFPSQDGSFFVFAEDSDAGLITYTQKKNRIEGFRRYGARSEFPVFPILVFSSSYLLIFLAPLAMVLIVAWMMRKYRTPHYEYEGQVLNYASVTRRAFAYLIDSFIISIPVIAICIAAAINLFRTASTSDDNGVSSMIMMLVLVMVSIFLMMAGMVLFSYLEGKYGQTPGKRLLKIKVLGTELKPCGFGRAIFRNLLLLADGFWNGLLGIAFVAYTENWQRVGDLAARTIVVDVSERI